LTSYNSFYCFCGYIVFGLPLSYSPFSWLAASFSDYFICFMFSLCYSPFFCSCCWWSPIASLDNLESIALLSFTFDYSAVTADTNGEDIFGYSSLSRYSSFSCYIFEGVSAYFSLGLLYTFYSASFWVWLRNSFFLAFSVDLVYNPRIGGSDTTPFLRLGRHIWRAT
jgi:hypothetical protein